MNRTISILIVFTLLVACQREDVEPSSNAFYKIFGGDYQEEGLDLLETEDGGFIIVGYTTSKSGGEEKDVYIVKTNEYGVAEWTRILLDNNQRDDEATRVIRTLEDNENYLIVGTTAIDYPDSTRSDIYICKISAEGSVFWENTYDTNVLTEGQTITNKADFGVDIQLRLDGSFVVVGNSMFDDGFEIISFITNQDGQRIDDMFTFGLESEGIGEVNDIVYKVINNQNPLVSASGLIVGSSDASPSGSIKLDNVYVLYYSENLTNISESVLTGSTNQRGEDVVWSLDGGYMVLSTYNYDNQGFGDMQLLKVNDNNLNFQTPVNISNELNTGIADEVTRGRAIARGNGRYVIAGEYKERANADSDILLMETDAAGNVNWTQFYGGDNTDRINSVIITRSGDIAFTGMLSFFDTDQVTKMILVKTNENGEIVP